jgi:hypothetical protein
MGPENTKFCFKYKSGKNSVKGSEFYHVPPPFINIKYFSFMKQMYLDIF